MLIRPHTERTKIAGHCCQGMSLLDLVVVVTLIGIVALVGLRAGRHAFEQNRLTETISALPGVVVKAEKVYSQQPNYADLSDTSAIGLGIVPTSWVRGGLIVTPLDGQLIFTAQNLGQGGLNDSAYMVTLNSFPKSFCAAFVYSLTALGRAVVIGPSMLPRPNDNSVIASGHLMSGLTARAGYFLVRQPTRPDINLSNLAAGCDAGGTGFVSIHLIGADAM